MTVEPGLRERKKRATRQRISTVAVTMFAARGFDNVTVAEVAEAANVSKMTVFNYFPHKEELVFDRGDEARELIGHALRARPPGQPVAVTVHRLMLELIETGHPLSGVRDELDPFWQIVADSPALRSAARNNTDRLEWTLTDLLYEEVDHKPDDPPAELAAAVLVAGYRTVYRRAVTAALAGRGAAEIRPEAIALTNQAFAMLTTALGDYGAKEWPPSLR
jgi:AcrR family transcriptional regulator